MELVTDTIHSFGGIDIVSFYYDNSFLLDYDRNREKQIIMEKYTEDFYRIIRQERIYYINGEIKSPIKKKRIIEDIKEDTKIKKEDKKEIEIELNEEQEEDIKEITKYFASKLGEKEEDKKEPNKKPEEIKKAPKEKDKVKKEDKKIKKEEKIEPLLPNLDTSGEIRLEQKTAGLVHKFKGKSKDLDISIQLEIEGPQGFEGYFIIKNGKNDFYNGSLENPNITIMGKEDIWESILDGNITNQRAFMTGQIKVRGNFVLLSKFDEIYNYG